ncbi:hypothetical protein [Cupriavidus necator]|uniref:hypothetical protein n=1 Tax=Cupriavidus necator TaxID=106590 RepID=UPI00339D584B
MRGIIAVILLLITAPGIAKAVDVAEFMGRSVHVKFKKRDYVKVVEQTAAEGTAAEKKGVLFEIVLAKRRPIGGNRSDTGTVCLGNVATCQTIGQGVLPYWFDANSALRIGDPTATVREIPISSQRAFEAFHLCGWEQQGKSMPFGGQCYTLVLPLEGKVVSLTFLLGRNTGCKRYEACWRKELEKARWIAANVM